MPSSKQPKESLNLNLSSDLVIWLRSKYPKEISETIEPLIRKFKEDQEEREQTIAKRLHIPNGMRRENGFVEYAHGKWIEEDSYWRLESILKETHSSKLY